MTSRISNQQQQQDPPHRVIPSTSGGILSHARLQRRNLVDIEYENEQNRVTRRQSAAKFEEDELEDEEEEDEDEDGDEEDEDEEDEEGTNYELDEYPSSHESGQHHFSNMITYAPVSSNSSPAKRKRANACLNDPALVGEVIQVNCNSVVAELFKKKFGSGGKGHCIRVIDETEDKKLQERWMTPIEFESYCGKGNCRDWKRTIKAGGQPLIAILNAKILVCHAVSCSCAVCNRNDSLVGPIKPFIRYKRRKKDQIVAENAFKKFLSLKPPTLFRDNGNIGAGNSSMLLSGSSPRPIQLPQPRVLNEHSNASAFDVSNSNEIHDTSHTLTGNEDLFELIEHFQETEDRKWSNLEQMAESLSCQARALKNSIISAKQESERMRRLVIDRLISNASTVPSPGTNAHTSKQNTNPASKPNGHFTDSNLELDEPTNLRNDDDNWSHEDHMFSDNDTKRKAK